MPPSLRPIVRHFSLPSTHHTIANRSPALLAAAIQPVDSFSPARPAACFSDSAVLRSASAHGEESKYDPPTGWLFGVKPGEKYKKEGWEGLFYWGFCGSFVVAAIAYAYKPDTSIQTWALEEARRRLEAEGILPDPFPNGVPEDGSKKST